MRVFVTGGAGFIGSYLCKHHLDKGDEVWALDNFFTGSPKNLDSFVNHPNFHFTNDDLLIWPDLGEAVHWADRIYHMAALVGQKIVIAQPIRVLEENVLGCQKLLKAMSTKKTPPQFLIASSSEVYGKNRDSLCHENENIHISSGECIQSSYPLSKLMDEILGLAYVKEKNYPCTIARLFNTTGARQTGRYGMVVPRFVEQAMLGNSITVFGTGSQTRSFCDVRDMVIMLDLTVSNSKSYGEIFNLGNDKEISIQQLAELVKKTLHSSSLIKHISYEEAYGFAFKDVERRKPDLKKIKNLIHYEPQWTLEKTILSISQSLYSRVAK